MLGSCYMSDPAPHLPLALGALFRLTHFRGPECGRRQREKYFLPVDTNTTNLALTRNRTRLRTRKTDDASWQLIRETFFSSHPHTRRESALEITPPRKLARRRQRRRRHVPSTRAVRQMRRPADRAVAIFVLEPVRFTHPFVLVLLLS